jgi:hypothetical protein
MCTVEHKNPIRVLFCKKTNFSTCNLHLYKTYVTLLKHTVEVWPDAELQNVVTYDIEKNIISIHIIQSP